MPHAMALTWELVKSDLPASTRKATLLYFDTIFGLRLAGWEPIEVIVPEEVTALAQQRDQARAQKRWQDADALRRQIIAAGYTIEDTPQGARVRSCKPAAQNRSEAE
jgi:cysteinyl-tRNA synthetase